MKKNSRVIWVLGLLFLMAIFVMEAPGEGRVKISWHRKADMPEARRNLKIAAVGDKIYALGGYAQPYRTREKGNFCYDIKGDTWSVKSDMLVGRSNFAVASVNEKVYAIAGDKLLPDVEVYDPVKDSWTSLAPLSIGRQHVNGAVLDQKIHVMGGLVKSPQKSPPFDKTPTHEVYEITNNSWQMGTPFPQKIENPIMSVVRDRLYVIDASDRSLRVFDPGRKVWMDRTKMPSAYFIAGSTVIEDKIFVLDGVRPQEKFSRLFVYDTADDSWSEASSLPAGLKLAGFTSVNNKLYVIGGCDHTFAATRSCFVGEVMGEDPRVESLIQQVETGLNPSVIVNGLTQWTLQERMDHYGVPGVSLAVIHDFKLHWAKGYGLANTRTGKVVTDTTLFQAASISKPVTAAIALKLVQQGILKLDGDVNQRLKSWRIPENDLTREEKVTLRRLLSHNAGLTVHGFRGYGKGEKVPTILEVLDGKPPANSKPVRVDKKPGSGFRYSGGGYTVLQLLIEDVMERPLAGLARKNIFEPLGMKHSSFEKPLPKSLQPLRSSPHSRQGEPLPSHWFLKGGSACCGLWTTASDLARFAIEIQRIVRGETSRILSPAMAKAMVTPASSETMGLGFGLARVGEGFYFQHSGGNPPGYSCLLFAHKTKGYGVAIMTNSYGGGSLCREIIQAVADAYHWEGFDIQRFATVDQQIKAYRQLRQKNPVDRRISQNTINRLGYMLMQGGHAREALKIFLLNCDFYPWSANCYDSLGDAYQTLDDHKNALESYQKVLQVLDKYPRKNFIFRRLRKVTGDKIKKLQKTKRE